MVGGTACISNEEVQANSRQLWGQQKAQKYSGNELLQFEPKPGDSREKADYRKQPEPLRLTRNEVAVGSSPTVGFAKALHFGGFRAARWSLSGSTRRIGQCDTSEGARSCALGWIAGGRGCERTGGLGRPEVEASQPDQTAGSGSSRQARAGVDRPDRRCFVWCPRRVDPASVSSSPAPAG